MLRAKHMKKKLSGGGGTKRFWDGGAGLDGGGGGSSPLYWTALQNPKRKVMLAPMGFRDSSFMNRCNRNL